MKYVLAFSLMALMAFAANNVRAAEPTVAGIAAVVNDEAISMADVRERMKLVIVSSGLPNNPEIHAKIMPQVIEGLIEEQLKLQEARRSKLEVSDEEVQEGLAVIAKQNNYEPEQFTGLLTKAGIDKKTLLRQIEAQLAWNKFVKEVLRKRVDVSETDVDVRLNRMKEKVGQTEYLVSQIFMPLDNPKRNAETVQFVGRMAKELQAKKAPFGPVAAQFSKAAGAEKGGSLGWIQEGQIGEDLDKVLMTLQEGQVSDPIQSQGGLYLLYLQKKRTLTEEAIPARDELTNQIGFERLDRAQQRALLDLKSAAFIDRRV